MAVLTPNSKQQFFDNTGRPLVKGQLFTYAAGTTTKLASYVNAAGITQNSNPIILDYRGECNLWVPPNVAYKYTLSPSTDSDPPTNPIWTVDNIVNSQLLTLYGGVDTGAVNAYILNFTASFSAYADGIIIYWIPSNNNNAAGATINVNGLGVVPIVNQNGTPLYANEIVANQVAQILYKGGQFVLISPSGAAFTGCRVTTAQSMPASTVTDCFFNAAIVNQGGGFSSSNGIFTAPEYGIYQFNVTLFLVPGGTNCVLNAIYFSKNNATSGVGSRFDIGYGLIGALYSNTSNSFSFAGSLTAVMNTNDTMRVKWDAGASGAGTNSMGLNSTFSGGRVA